MAQVIELGELWVHRDTVATGNVSIEEDPSRPTPPFGEVRLDFMIVRSWERRTTDSSAQPVDPPSFERVSGTTSPARPQPDGTFRVALPRIRGATLRASLPGWRPAWHEVPASGAKCDVGCLRLRRIIRIRGTLRSTDGSPLAEALVAAYSTRKSDFWASNPFALRMHHQGAVAALSERDDTASLTVIGSHRTDSRGEFEVPLEAEGEVLLVAWATGYTPGTRRLGWIVDVCDAGDMQLVPSAAARVRLTERGAPLRGHRVSVADLSFGHPQPCIGPLDCADDGSIPGEWFERDRKYTLVVQRPADAKDPNPLVGSLTWSGQSEIDVAKDLERVK